MKRYGRWTLLLLLLLLGVLVIIADAEDGRPDVVGGSLLRMRLLRGSGVEPRAKRETSVSQGRTFGQKRIQFMLMPMIYKMGVMMTMMTFLTIISLKGLMIGVVLLILKLSAIFGKAYSFFSSSHHGHSPGWAPPPQPVHVHVHNSGGGGSSSGWGAHSQAYGGWETAGPPGPPPDEHYYYKG